MKKLAVGLMTVVLLGTTTYAHHTGCRGYYKQAQQTTYCQYYVDANQDGVCDNCKTTYCNGQNQSVNYKGQGYGHHRGHH